NKVIKIPETLQVYGDGFSTYKLQLDAFIKAVQHVHAHPAVAAVARIDSNGGSINQNAKMLEIPG
ncbi:hypothetical protein BGZ47_010950, partial [Haplosporangium gracile]